MPLTLPRAHRCCVSHTDRRVTPRVHLRLHGSELTLCPSWVLSAHPPAGCNVTHLSALQIPTLLSNRSSHTNSEKFCLTFRAQGWLPPSSALPYTGRASFTHGASCTASRRTVSHPSLLLGCGPLRLLYPPVFWVLGTEAALNSWSKRIKINFSSPIRELTERLLLSSPTVSGTMRGCD